VIFVDDSTDDTVEQIRRAGRASGLAVALLHRGPGEATGGLGGAVLAGFRASRAPWAVVMDADLQHPAELVKHMLMVGQSREVDLVVGTRKVDGGGNEGLDGAYRRAVSGATTRAVKTLFPRRLGLISDPMSGLFAVRLAAVDLDRLRPHGFKILLEIAVRTPNLRVAEIPFTFGDRIAGESKASAREGMRFVRQVGGLRLQVLRKQIARSGSTDRGQWLRRLVIFGLVGVSGIVVNEAVLWLFLQQTSSHYLLGAILATEASTLWNFAWTDTVVFRGEKPGSGLGRFVRFWLLNHVALVLRLPVLALLVGVLGADALVGNLVTLLLLFLFRFLVADGSIYAREQRPADAPAPTRDPMRVVVHAPVPPVTAAETAAVTEMMAGCGWPRGTWRRSNRCAGPEARICPIATRWVRC
jgi:putative flippase GtrA